MWDRVGTDGKLVLPVLNIRMSSSLPPSVQKFHFLYFEITMWQPVFTKALNKYVYFPMLVGRAIRKNAVYVHVICFF